MVEKRQNTNQSPDLTGSGGIVITPAGDKLSFNVDGAGAGSSVDEKVKAAAADPTPGFLDAKITGVGGVVVSTVANQIQVDGSGIAAGVLEHRRLDNVTVQPPGNWDNNSRFYVLIDGTLDYRDRLLYIQGNVQSNQFGTSPGGAIEGRQGIGVSSSDWGVNTGSSFALCPWHTVGGVPLPSQAQPQGAFGMSGVQDIYSVSGLPTDTGFGFGQSENFTGHISLFIRDTDGALYAVFNNPNIFSAPTYYTIGAGITMEISIGPDLGLLP